LVVLGQVWVWGR